MVVTSITIGNYYCDLRKKIYMNKMNMEKKYFHDDNI